jgi:N-glycosidase YbiA
VAKMHQFVKDNMSIKFYKLRDPGGFMSNFWPAKIYIYGCWWRWVEAPYQSQKTYNLAEKKLIWEATKPMQARDLGQTVTMISDWDQIKRTVMKECCLAKFLQHADLRKQLMETGTEELIEDSPVDSWWGCGKDGTGQNVLGQVLMEIREELRGE